MFASEDSRTLWDMVQGVHRYFLISSQVGESRENLDTPFGINSPREQTTIIYFTFAYADNRIVRDQTGPNDDYPTRQGIKPLPQVRFSNFIPREKNAPTIHVRRADELQLEALKIRLEILLVYPITIKEKL